MYMGKHITKYLKQRFMVIFLSTINNIYLKKIINYELTFIKHLNLSSLPVNS